MNLEKGVGGATMAWSIVRENVYILPSRMPRKASFRLQYGQIVYCSVKVLSLTS